MVKRNSNITKLSSGYLFPEINKRKTAFLEKNPDIKLISLGIGDTTEPIYPFITKGLTEASKNMGTVEGYRGYGPDQGEYRLRELISNKIYNGKVQPEDIFISDGAKCDIGRLQVLFGADVKMAVQDPSYPAYVDTAVILGQTGRYNPTTSQYDNIIYWKCTPENSFFPHLSEEMQKPDVIYFCSPNNPTGAIATREQLKSLVDYAKKNKSIIVFDSAYFSYIQDSNYPKSIYEIEGADEVSIEVSSFSKMAGFTGVRLGWSVVPSKLTFENGESIKKDWSRIQSTFFNGASHISQLGGIAVLEDEGLTEVAKMVNFYLENTEIIKSSLLKNGYICFAGNQVPFVWVSVPGFRSWEIFDQFLERFHIVVTPGSGFGISGEGFVRISAFGHKKDLVEAARRIKPF